MMLTRDPTSMSPAERLAAVAEILARGYLRHVVRRHGRIPSKELAEGRESEAPCDQAVNAGEKPPGKETA